jgi:serine/threonine protein kinase
MTLEAGTFVTPNVRLVERLGGGGMGSVWLADHLGLHSRVVVKLMSPTLVNSEESRARFAREAAAAALVRSPHTVPVFDHGVTNDGVPYIMMELLEGEDLEQLLTRRGRLTLGEVAVIVAHVGKALQRAHERGVIHRDIKPQNIFLRDVGNNEIFAMVLDFGIAKTRDQLLSKLTKTGIMMGTPFYMSPEQLIQNKPVDPQADLWSLAVVAYESITGELPFPGATAVVVGMAMMHGPRPVASSVLTGIPRAVDAWFERAFAPEPRQRFGSAREMANAFLDATRTSLSSAPSSPRESQPQPEPRAHKGAETVALDLQEAPPVVAREVVPVAANDAKGASAGVLHARRPIERGETRGFDAPPSARLSRPILETHAFEAPNTTQALPGKKVAAAVAKPPPVPTAQWDVGAPETPAFDPEDIALPGILKRKLPPSPDRIAPTRRVSPAELPEDVALPGILKRKLPPSPDRLAATRKLLPADTQRRMRVEVEVIEEPADAPPLPVAMPLPLDDEPLPRFRPRFPFAVVLSLAALTVILLLIVATR